MALTTRMQEIERRQQPYQSEWQCEYKYTTKMMFDRITQEESAISVFFDWICHEGNSKNPCSYSK
jgi:hypothetical protein